MTECWTEAQNPIEIAKAIKAAWLGDPRHFGDNMEIGRQRDLFFMATTEFGMHQLYVIDIFNRSFTLAVNSSGIMDLSHMVAAWNRLPDAVEILEPGPVHFEAFT
jgi:hypothetical protein